MAARWRPVERARVVRIGLDVRDELGEEGIDRDLLQTTGFGIEEHYERQARKNYNTEHIFAGFECTHSSPL